MSDAADERIAALEKELMGMQQILALVLQHIGEPVVITDKQIVEGLPEGTQIFIDEHKESFSHTIGLTYDVVDKDA